LIREPDRDVLIRGGVRAVGDVTLDEEWQAELVRAAAAGEAVVVEEGRGERPTLLGLLAKLAAWRCTCDRCERLVREVGAALGVEVDPRYPLIVADLDGGVVYIVGKGADWRVGGVSKMSKTWLGAVLEEHLLVAIFLYNLALVKGGRVVYWARPTRDRRRALSIYGRLFDEGLLRLWKAPRNAAVLAQYVELIREMAEETGVEELREAYAVFSDSGLDAVREVVQFLRERGVEIPEVDVRRALMEEEVRKWLRGVLKFLS